jgi:DNA-binding NtrC family response regulator
MREENFRILVVDDEQSFALLVSRILKDEGYRVETSLNPDDALVRIDAFRPDLVISDLRMPGMSGLDFMTAAKEKHPETDFILITAFATVETAVSAMKLGAVDYITKPLRDPQELREVVRRVFEKQQLLAENRALRDEVGGGLPPLPLIFSGIEKVREEIEAVAPRDNTIKRQKGFPGNDKLCGHP